MSSVLVVCGVSMLICSIYTLILPTIDSVRQRGRVEGRLDALAGVRRANRSHPVATGL